MPTTHALLLVMDRDIIHHEFPFTAEEVAAAWILHGVSVDEALRDGIAMQEALREELNGPLESSEDPGGGWFSSSGPGGVAFFGGFDASLNLIADVHSSGNILSTTAREAWLEQWPHNFHSDRIDELINHLGKIGPSWEAKRAELRQLLQRRGSPRHDIL
jgi:hypothetical protein